MSSPVSGRKSTGQADKIERLTRRVKALEKEVAVCKKRENQLAKKERLYRLYFRENVAGLYITTPEGQLLLCNRAFLKIFGFTSTRKAMEMAVSDLYFFPEDRGAFIDTLLTQKKVVNYEYCLKKLDGTRINLIGNAFAAFDREGNLEYLQGSLLDITHQKLLERQLINAQKMEAIGTLAGGIAHDFNNILSVIFGNAQLARSRIDFREKALPHIDNIVAGAQRASELVQQILTFSKQTPYKKHHFRPEGIIKEVLEFIRSTIPTSIEMDVKLGPTQKILADSAQMHRLLINLCVNAFHAMQDDTVGTLGISLEEIIVSQASSPGYPSGNYAKIQISDTGHGIDQKNMDQIFDPYFTTDITGGGTGLGLASVRSIIEEHNGYIKVDSILGRGSKFTVYFPIVATDPPRNQQKENNQKPARGSGTIMVIDDEQDICTAYRQILEEFGYKAHTYSSGPKALIDLKAGTQKFDLIITDLNMPKMRGNEFIPQALKVVPRTPVILCTGYSQGFGRENAFASGASYFIEKPIDMYELVRTVNHALEQTKGKDKLEQRGQINRAAPRCKSPYFIQ